PPLSVTPPPDHSPPSLHDALPISEALAVKIDKKHIGEISELSIEDAQKWFGGLHKKLDKQRLQIADKILKEINDRLNFLMNVGLDRKSTRLNSSHVKISYAVFCLK